MWRYGLIWYPFALIMPGICITLSWIMNKLEHIPPVKMAIHILNVIGGYSLELYLVHILVFEVMEFTLPQSTPYYWPFALGISAVGVIVLRRCSQWLIQVIQHFSQKGKEITLS